MRWHFNWKVNWQRERDKQPWEQHSATNSKAAGIQSVSVLNIESYKVLQFALASHHLELQRNIKHKPHSPMISFIHRNLNYTLRNELTVGHTRRTVPKAWSLITKYERNAHHSMQADSGWTQNGLSIICASKEMIANHKNMMANSNSRICRMPSRKIRTRIPGHEPDMKCEQ
jgi:hypothetical protein